MTRWFDDFANDIAGGGFSAADVRIACGAWRTSEARKMPSPGELLAKCRAVTFYADRVQPLPARPAPMFRDEENLRVGAMVADLARQMRGRPRQADRRPGETETDFARRVWPEREVVR